MYPVATIRISTPHTVRHGHRGLYSSTPEMNWGSAADDGDGGGGGGGGSGGERNAAKLPLSTTITPSSSLYSILFMYM